MKQAITQIALTACAIFTAFMIFSLTLAYIYIGPNEGLTMTLGLLIASFVGAFIQCLWFTEFFIKSMRYSYRLLGFAVTFAPVLFAISQIFGWFPLNPASIAVFFAIYLAIFGIMAFGYTLYFRKTAGSYEEALKRYRAQRRTND